MTKQSLTMIAGCLAALIQSSHDASAMPIAAADPAAVVAITAPSQQGTAGSPVSTPPGVLVRDASNNPVSGVTVVFVVISGGGVVTPSSRVTGTDGIARLSSWTLGPASGANAIVAKVTGLPGVAFTATASAPITTAPTASAAARLEAVPGSTQQFAAGLIVAVPPSVKVVDLNGNPVSGARVDFRVASGGGTIQPAYAITGNDGIARTTSWRLGVIPGPNTVTAALGTLTPVRFYANGVPVPVSAQASPPMSLTLPVGSTVPPPGVIVRDAAGNPVANASVRFSVTAGGGTIYPTSMLTGPDGIARIERWILGSRSGTNTVKATPEALPNLEIEFTVNTPYTLIVFVKDPNGRSIANAQVCIGTRADLDQIATVRDAGTYGREIFNLTAAPEYFITASKGGFVGTSMMYGPSGSSGSSTLTLTAGSGGPVCPGAQVSVDAVTSIPLAPSPMPDLAAKVAQSSTTIVGGARQTYKVTVNNRGAAAAGGIVLRSALPADLSWVSSSSNKGFVCSRSGTTATCSSGVIPAGDSATIQMVMSLALAAHSGHEIVFGTKVDPDNSINESNEANNQASAAATTEAAVAPVVDYKLTASRDLNELFQLAKANGFEFHASSLDKDILGHPVRCNITFPDPGANSTPMLGAFSDAPPLNTELRCFYTLFGNRKLAAGWQLRATGWSNSDYSTTAYVDAPIPSSGSAYFTMQTRWSSPVSTNAREWLESITLRGPVDADWRNAFR